MEREKHPEIALAIQIVGKQAVLAQKIGCAQQTVSKMLNRSGPVSAENALRIDRATGGLVPKWRLRPDLWQPATVAEMSQS